MQQPDHPPAAATPVDAIFARAERVFERRVDQLLALKRAKARLAGTPFNARKAKRDARTVAGREKLDALVRRLADLAVLQQDALGSTRALRDAQRLDSAAAALLGFLALQHHLHNPVHDPPAPPTDDRERERIPLHTHRAPPSPPPYSPRLPLVSPVSPTSHTHLHPHARVPVDDPDAGREILDTSSCSDDASMTAAASWHTFRDLKEDLDLEPCEHSSAVAEHAQKMLRRREDGPLFHAIHSVVNFVLDGEEDPHRRDRTAHTVSHPQLHSHPHSHSHPHPHPQPHPHAHMVARPPPPPTPPPAAAHRHPGAMMNAAPYDHYEEHHGVTRIPRDAYDYRTVPPPAPPQMDWPRTPHELSLRTGAL